MNSIFFRILHNIRKLETQFELLPKSTQYASAALSILIVTLVAVNTPVLKNILFGTTVVPDAHVTPLSLPTEIVGSETE